MLARLFSAYRRYVGQPSIRRAAQVAVEPLEPRATPTVTADPVPTPPEIVHLGQLGDGSHEAAVRPDLFGAADGTDTHEDVWAEWWSKAEELPIGRGARAPVQDTDQVEETPNAESVQD